LLSSGAMGKPIVITVEILEADFIADYEVDPDRPLVDLVRRIAKEEGIALVTRSGRPLSWEARGPDWREGKEGITDLIRTQPLSRIAERAAEEHGDRSPLFLVELNIPGAAASIQGARDAAKSAEIEARLAAREAEREAERQRLEGEARSRLAEMDGVEDIVTQPMESIVPPAGPADISLEDAPTELDRAPPGPPGAALNIREPAAPEKPVEQRIRRADGAGPKRKKKRKKKAAAATGPGGLPLPWLIGGGVALAGLVLVVIVVAVVASSEPEPEPTPTPTPATVPDVVVDIPIATKTPEPTPPPAETPPPVKFETYYSKGTLTRNNGEATGAQISSYAKSEVKLGYKVNLAASGAHTIGLKGRFKLKVTDGGSTLSGGSTKACRAIPVGKEVRVSLHWTGDTVSARINGKRCGPIPVSGTSGFPGWQFDIDPGVTLTGVWASAPVEE
jgi:hypothetical protein